MNSKNNNEITADIQTCGGASSCFYSNDIKDHFLNPRNFLIDERNYEHDGFGYYVSPSCGDTMAVYIRVYQDEDGIERIKECQWQTFGCAGVISTTSLMSVLVTENRGMSLEEIQQLKPEMIIEKLGGLPENKFHCANLGPMALKIAIENYLENKDGKN